MKLLFDFFPILLFFIIYKFLGIFYATAAAMIASAAQVAGYWLVKRRFEMMHLITLLLVVILGSATLLLHDAMFIKWKPTAIYWCFAIICLIMQFVGHKNLVERLFQSKINLPKIVWTRLNYGWIVFFSLMGVINLYVVYHFSTNAWVNFKLFGTLILTLLFGVVQTIYMSKHMQVDKNIS